ncbi:MAG: recombination mediator RecR [Patescibacteria group bacterium]
MNDKPITDLVAAFMRLPSVGQKTAERFVLSLLKSGRGEVGKLTLALTELSKSVKSCILCQDFTTQSPCGICNDSRRDHGVICVVADTTDAMAIEKSGAYNGVYHMLRGTIDAIEGVLPSHLKVPELMARMRAEDPKVREVILALNPDIPGETTMLYLQRELAQFNVKVSRLARGLPIGASLAYADEVTLTSALKERKEIK